MDLWHDIDDDVDDRLRREALDNLRHPASDGTDERGEAVNDAVSEVEAR